MDASIIAAIIGAIATLIAGWWARERYFSSSERKPGYPTAPPRSDSSEESVPDYWHGVLPEDSKYGFTGKTVKSLPIGEQSVSLEYGPRGHAEPLTLKGTRVKADIHFTCHIVVLDKVFGGDEYPLNMLQPRFLTLARGILETYSLSKLREKREEVANQILARLKPVFSDGGFSLDSVTIGALEKVN